MSRLGDTIREARTKKGLTEKQLAKKAGMTEAVVKEIELGRRIVTDDQARRILKLLGVDSPVSTELEVAAEPEVQPRPRPRAYVLPVPEPEKVTVHSEAEAAASDAWLDALTGVVKRVPVTDSKGIVIDHVLEPIVGGKIEGASPDKVSYYRCADNLLSGFRIYAGDLLLIVPQDRPQDGELMLILDEDERVVRRVRKMDGQHFALETYDRDYASKTLPLTSLRVLGRCVKLERRL